MALVAYWPSSVNQRAFIGSYQETPNHNTVSFAPEVGPPMMRRRTSLSTKKLTFDSILSTAECATLESFWRNTLKDGTLPFARVNPRSGITHVYNFSEPFRRSDWSLDKDKVSFSLQKHPTFPDGPTTWGGNDSFAKLLLHFDGADGATTTVDSAAGAASLHPMTMAGGVTLYAATKMFGSASLVFPLVGASGQEVRTPSAADLTPAGDYTWEFWVNLFSYSTYWALGKGLFGPYLFYFDGTNWRFDSSSNGAAWNISSNNLIGAPPGAGIWHHVAVCRSGNTYYPFVNGVMGATFASALAPFSNATALTIGESNIADNTLIGWLDEIRFSNGIARYTSNFTPNADAFST